MGLVAGPLHKQHLAIEDRGLLRAIWEPVALNVVVPLSPSPPPCYIILRASGSICLHTTFVSPQTITPHLIRYNTRPSIYTRNSN